MSAQCDEIMVRLTAHIQSRILPTAFEGLQDPLHDQIQAVTSHVKGLQQDLDNAREETQEIKQAFAPIQRSVATATAQIDNMRRIIVNMKK